MKTLYFDCFSGIAGDMTIGAMLDLGLDLEYLKTELRKLPVEGYELKASRVVRANLSAMKFDVIMQGDGPQSHGHGHIHGAGHSHAHFHRRASEIFQMIGDSRLNSNVKRIATRIFRKLAESEGRVHHIAPEDVEFHEVGAIDSIVDTVGSAIGFDALGIERFLCSPINVGGGFIHCQHGVYPSPAPATADLLRGAEIYSKYVQVELVTPTGAAILAAVVDRFARLSGFVTERIGYGAGTKQFQDLPNCVRLMLGEEVAESLSGSASQPEPENSNAAIIVMEANIDDMPPQNFAYLAERLFDAGALDVATIPLQMKKGRPGQLLQVLSPPNRTAAMSQIIFRETTTIGIRSHRAVRETLEREVVTVETEYGPVAVKISKLDGEVVSRTPEYEDCVRIARQTGAPLKDIQAAALRALAANF